MSKTLMVTIETVGRIPAICGDGPILVPTRMSYSLVSKLVMSGVRVYDHNPNDIHQKVLLTRNNINTDRFPPVVPERQEHPVGRSVPEVSFENPVREEPAEEDDSITADESSEEEIETDDHEEVEPTPAPAPAVAQAPTVDKYAGMSKNQRKRARQAEAAARAAANNGGAQ